MAVHAYYPATREAKVGGADIQGPMKVEVSLGCMRSCLRKENGLGMVPWVKNLLCKHGDLVPSTPQKAGHGNPYLWLHH